MIRQYELVERVSSYDPDASEASLNRAYVFSMSRHGSQTRASGDPYFSHPVEVAGILTDLKLDGASIITALLHDTVEDGVASQEEVDKIFGDEIGRLVDGVTKLGKIELQSHSERQAENFRKFLLAMSEDIRVLLVKLADRLHNMRTLHFIEKPEKRLRIAVETMDIYVPLAERIGMRLAVEASVPGVTSVAGVMEADGELEYHPETGRFTIAKGRLVDLELQGMPKQQMKLFEEMAQAVVTKQLASLTVYQLDQEDFKQSLAKLVLKSVQVRDGAIIVEVGL